MRSTDKVKGTMAMYGGNNRTSLPCSTTEFAAQTADHFTLGLFPQTCFPSAFAFSPPAPYLSSTQRGLPLTPYALPSNGTGLATHVIPLLCPKQHTTAIHCSVLASPRPIFSVGAARASATTLKATRRHRRAIRSAAAARTRRAYPRSDNVEETMSKKKRVKNRQAVAKCRSRKLAKISALALEQGELEEENLKLERVLELLKVEGLAAPKADPLLSSFLTL